MDLFLVLLQCFHLMQHTPICLARPGEKRWVGTDRTQRLTYFGTAHRDVCGSDQTPQLARLAPKLLGFPRVTFVTEAHTSPLCIFLVAILLNRKKNLAHTFSDRPGDGLNSVETERALTERSGKPRVS